MGHAKALGWECGSSPVGLRGSCGRSTLGLTGSSGDLGFYLALGWGCAGVLTKEARDLAYILK